MGTAAESASPVSLALLEVASIARGYAAADALVKAASITLARVEPVTPGKLLILYHGRVAELEVAETAGVAAASDHLIDRLLLPGVHAGVLPALAGRGGDVGDALGILECRTVAAGLLAADAAAKVADVRLLEIHAARGIGGKTTILFTGSVADAEASIEAGAAAAGSRGALVEKVVIARAHPDFKDYLKARAKGEAP